MDGFLGTSMAIKIYNCGKAIKLHIMDGISFESKAIQIPSEGLVSHDQCDQRVPYPPPFDLTHG
jgi:hypothetical protein